MHVSKNSTSSFSSIYRGDIYIRKTIDIKTNFYKVRCQVVHVGEIRFLKRQALGVWNNSVKEWREMTQQPPLKYQTDPIRVQWTRSGSTIRVPTLRKCWARLDMNLGPIWVFSDSLHPKESKIIWTRTGSILELEIWPWVQTEPQQEVGKKKTSCPNFKKLKKCLN